MKLIDLLVKELPNRGGWPANISYIAQDEGSATWGFRYKPEKDSDDEWMDCSDAGYEIRIGYIGDADDCNTSVISKQQYKAALAASEGWIEWNGGECPVGSDAIVEVKYRKTNPYQYNNDRAGDFIWLHTGSGGDIMAYRLHKPDAKSRANDDRLEQDLNECIGQGVDVPEWNGEGLPPVGTVCMANLANGWADVKVAYIGDEGGCHEALVFEVKTTKPAWADEFRPLRTEVEKEREAVCHEIASMIGRGTFFEDAERIYDAIAEGKIPGVKLEGK